MTTAGIYTYPDLMVVCGAAEFADQRTGVLLNPGLIVEVLSQRGEKFKFYRRLSSLKEYVIIAQDKVHVEAWTRQPGNEWAHWESKGSGTVRLQSVQVDLRISDIYDQVDVERD